MNLAGLYNTLRRITPVINSVTQGIGSLNAGMNALQAATPEYKKISAVDAVNTSIANNPFPTHQPMPPWADQSALALLLQGVGDQFPEVAVPDGTFVDTADVEMDYPDNGETEALWYGAGAVPVYDYGAYEDPPEVYDFFRYPDYYTWDTKDAEMQNAQRKEYARQHPRRPTFQMPMETDPNLPF